MVATGFFWDRIDPAMDHNPLISHPINMVEMVAGIFDWFVNTLDNLCGLVRKITNQGYSLAIPFA